MSEMTVTFPAPAKAKESGLRQPGDPAAGSLVTRLAEARQTKGRGRASRPGTSPGRFPG
ncbi:hypothetical protein STRIP9103_01628 [Streptomyces ipomoeae 91-03]|uniref:Uncharacterized protein n=1 Tax=Streptomyces ipomoeae 91-03 TaxID=698759 RepID=L1KHV6_9ACTN|nr:hypothetical protein STRIP9103_01628 [Streptomyces ipomoeae 91-03]